MNEMFQELLSSSPFSIIELFDLELTLDLHGINEVFRFHNGANGKITATGDIVFRGYTYYALPIEAEGFEYSGNGQLPRPKIRIANVLSSVSAILAIVNAAQPGSDLTGATLRRIRTLSRFIDPVNFENNVNPYGVPFLEEMPQEIYYVDRKSAETRDYVEFELAAAFDLAGVRAPKRQCIANICQWKYRGPECGYTGTNYFDENDNPLSSSPAANLPAGFMNIPVNLLFLKTQTMTSTNLWHQMTIDLSGRLVTQAKNGIQTWDAGVAGGQSLVITNDGNARLLDSQNNALWQTNTTTLGTPSAAVFNVTFDSQGNPQPDTAWAPNPYNATTNKSGLLGHRLAFFHEIMGSAQSQQNVTKTASYAFTDNGKTLTLQFTAISQPLPANHWSGQTWGWQDTTTNTYPTPTILSSNGFFRVNEVFLASIILNQSNPFRTSLNGTITTVTGSFKVTATTGYSQNYFVITNTGTLVLYNVNDQQLWSSGYSSAAEPRIAVNANNSVSQDICGKRLSSCKVRFGQNAQLPFGSFPGVGTFFS